MLARATAGATGVAVAMTLAAAPVSAATCDETFGDLNGDGGKTVADAQCAILATLWALTGPVGPPPACLDNEDAADLNCDSNINVTDVQTVIGQILGTPLAVTVDSDLNGCPDGCETGDLAAPTNPGDLVITEVMPNPSAVSDTDGEYFEVYNPTGTDFDLNGLEIDDLGSDSHIISGSVVVPAGEYAILARNGDSATNGGLNAVYVYADLTLANSSDELRILNGDTVIDEIVYDTSWPFGSGVAMTLAPGNLSADNNDPSAWCAAPAGLGLTDFGSPGVANPGCPVCGDGVVEGLEDCEGKDYCDAACEFEDPFFDTNIQPLIEAKCGNCHGSIPGFCQGNACIATDYASYSQTPINGICAGLTMAECVLERIQTGTMPPGGTCSGDGEADAAIPACFDATDQDFLSLWIFLGAPDAEAEPCGDGSLEAGEECDDGNNVNGDGCTSECLLEGTTPSPGDLIITEIMQNPAAVGDSAGEWIELYNGASVQLNLFGLVLSDAAGGNTIESPILVDPGTYIVAHKNDDPATNGGAENVTFEFTFALNNTSDSVTIALADGTVIDSVSYDNGATFPDPNGASMSLDINALDSNSNDSGAQWCQAIVGYGDGDLGTPGAPNPTCFPNFDDDIQSIITGTACSTCHNSANGFCTSSLCLDDFDDYAKTPANAFACGGLTMAECVSKRVQEGSMPTGGTCSGDPAVDTNPGCWDEFEQAIFEVWIANGTPENNLPIPVFTDDILPIITGTACSTCHNSANGFCTVGLCLDEADDYAKTPNAGTCAGLTMAECVLKRVQEGSMPTGGTCSGDPAVDTNPGCWTQAEQDLFQTWIDGGTPGL